MPRTILVALGGNAILRAGQAGFAAEQFENIRASSRNIVRMIQLGNRVVITHGNGPQVGGILARNIISQDRIPPMPLDVCVAESQGLIGYMIQQTLYNELLRANMEISVVTVLTQTVVDPSDPAFESPSKPVGGFRDLDFIPRQTSQSERWEQDPHRGWRRMVASPAPQYIVEAEVIKHLAMEGFIVIAAGGGGIPVRRARDYSLAGVEAVVDKDLCAAVLGAQLGAELLMMLTDVEKVYLHYGKPWARPIHSMSVDEALRHKSEGHFGRGSMEPKVEAAVRFVESTGGEAVIAPLEEALGALNGKAGTRIVPTESAVGGGPQAPTGFGRGATDEFA